MFHQENLPNLFVLFSVFMYVRVLPTSIETLPILLILLICYVFAWAILDPRLVLDTRLWTTFALIAVILAYAIPATMRGVTGVLEAAKYLVGPFTLLAIQLAPGRFSPRVTKTILWFLVILTVLVLVRLPLLVSLLEILIPRNSQTAGFRGLSVLTPEPSYFAHFAMLFLCVIEHLKYKKEVSRSEYRLLTVLIVMLTLISASVLSLLVLLFFFGWKLFHWNRVGLLIAMAAPVLAVVFADQMIDGRIKQVLLTLNSVFSSGFDLYHLLFLSDSSGTTRIILNAVGLAAPWYDPLGNGLGTFGDNFQRVANNLQLPVSSNEVLAGIDQSRLYAQTYLANFANDTGFFAAFALLVLFVPVFRVEKGYVGLFLPFMALMAFFQSQITNPIPWVIISIMLRMSREASSRR